MFVQEVLRRKGRDLDKELKTNANRKWHLVRIRRRVPPIAELLQRFQRLKEKWVDNPPEPVGVGQKSKPFWSKAGLAAMCSMESHIKNGCLSDPPGLQLYYEIGPDSDGLMMYRCVRGTNDVEGHHSHLASRFAKVNHMSLQLSDSLLAELRHRHNLKTHLRVRCEGNQRAMHYDTWLVDDIQRCTAELNGFPVDPEWVTLQHCLPEEQFGITQAPDPLMPGEERKEPHAGLRGDLRFLAARQKLCIPRLPVHTQAERELFGKVMAQFPLATSIGPATEAFNSKVSVSKGIYYKDAKYMLQYRKDWVQQADAKQQRSKRKATAPPPAAPTPATESTSPEPAPPPPQPPPPPPAPLLTKRPHDDGPTEEAVDAEMASPCQPVVVAPVQLPNKRMHLEAVPPASEPRKEKARSCTYCKSSTCPGRWRQEKCPILTAKKAAAQAAATAAAAQPMAAYGLPFAFVVGLPNPYGIAPGPPLPPSLMGGQTRAQFFDHPPPPAAPPGSNLTFHQYQPPGAGSSSQ